MSGTLWPVGVGFAMLASASGTAGKLLLRSSELLKNKQRHKSSRMALIAGLVLNTAVGPLLDLTSYAFAPQSLIAPFGGLDIVWNTLAAPVFLGEKTTTPRLCSVALVFSGTFASIFVGPHEDADYTVELLEDILFRWRVAAYFLVLMCWLVLNAALMRRPKGSSMRGFALGATAGTIAGNMFFAKGAAELIESSFVESSAEAWGTYMPWCLGVAAVFCAVGNLYFISTGMREHEAVFMVTIYEGSMIVSNCLSATVVLGEMDNSELWRIASYFSCIGLIICGLVLMLWGEGLKRISIKEPSVHGEEPAAVPLSDCPNNLIIARSVEKGVEQVASKVRSVSKGTATGERKGSKEAPPSRPDLSTVTTTSSTTISSPDTTSASSERSTFCVLPPCGPGALPMVSCDASVSLELVVDSDLLPGSVPSTTPSIVSNTRSMWSSTGTPVASSARAPGELEQLRTPGGGEAEPSHHSSKTLLC